MRAESFKAMRIGRRQQWHAMRPGLFSGPSIQIEPSFVKMTNLNRVEAIDLPQQARAERGAEDEKRMRRKTKKRVAQLGAQSPKIGEGSHVLDVVRPNIEEHDIGPFQSHFRGRDEEDVHRGRVGKDARLIENFVMQGNREGAETKRARAFEQLMRGIIEVVLGILKRVNM